MQSPLLIVFRQGGDTRLSPSFTGKGSNFLLARMGGITHTNAMQSNVAFCVCVYVCVPVFARECAHVRM